MEKLDVSVKTLSSLFTRGFAICMIDSFAFGKREFVPGNRELSRIGLFVNFFERGELQESGFEYFTRN
ncbi:MAG: hypothetical protein CMC93_07880 [Flavobacteriaceae bacterium]|nr:hypothetical protein [Flavobacteriaceae bacterium]|tara:strand:- start:1603 stop:1806 length:204 start_codon:yes stop_codon:yes gene_type:complete